MSISPEYVSGNVSQPVLHGFDYEANFGEYTTPFEQIEEVSPSNIQQTSPTSSSPTAKQLSLPRIFNPFQLLLPHAASGEERAEYKDGGEFAVPKNFLSTQWERAHQSSPQHAPVLTGPLPGFEFTVYTGTINLNSKS